jgi:PAS domain S-box-containing protein
VNAAVEVAAFDITDEHQLEDALAQSEARYRAFIEQTPIGVLHLDDAGTVAFENQHARDLLGIEPEEPLQGRALHSLPGFSEIAVPLLASVLADEEPASETIALPAPSSAATDYSVRHLVVRGGPIRGSDGVLIGGVLLLEDVTEREARRVLLRRQERFREASEQLREAALRHQSEDGFFPDALAVIGETLGADHAFFLACGASGMDCSARYAWHEEGERARSVGDLTRRDCPALWDEAQGYRYRSETNLSSPQDALLGAFRAGELLWHSLTENGETFGFLVLARERHRSAYRVIDDAPPWTGSSTSLSAELASLLATLWSWLSASQRYRRTVEVIDDALFNFSFHPDGRRYYRFATEPMRRFTGLPAEAFYQRSASGALDWLQHLVHEDDRFEVRQHEQALRRGEESRLTYRLRAPGGEVVWVRERAAPRRTIAGSLVVFGILNDVTEQHETEASLIAAREEAERSNQGKSAFVATMSHEIRTPLGTVNGFADLLAHEIDLLRKQTGVQVAPEVDEFVEAIQDGAQRVLRLVNDLFDLSNLEMGMLSLQRTPVDLNDLVRGEVAEVMPEVDAKGLSLHMQLGEHLPYAEADAQRLRQVVANLVSNAVKFTDSGTVSVSTSADERGVMLEVSDTGVGMSEDYLRRIFKPFNQEDDRLNRDYAGTGLGLALVKRLLDLMGGSIEVDSERERGTTFRIRLPRAALRPMEARL